MSDTALHYTTTDGAEVYYSEIHAALAEYIQQEKAEAEAEGEIFNMKKANQSTWNAALIYIYRTVFKNTNKLLNDNIFNIPVVSTTGKKFTVKSNLNSYNLDIVNDVVDIYINLCLEYSKEISIIGFNLLSGISSETITEWGGDKKTTYQLSDKSKLIYQKLVKFREESLSNKLVSSGQALGVLGVLNHHFGWSTERREVVHKIETQDAGAIAARYGLPIEQHDTGPDV